MSSRRLSFDQLLTAVIALCAVAMTGMAAQRYFAKPPDPRVPTVRKDWREFVSGDMRFGAVGAPVTIVVFSDFQCPFCKRLASSLSKLVDARPQDVEVVFRNSPIAGLHPAAMGAAAAAQCAAKQGKFRAMHDYMFEQQDSLGKISWGELAKRVGVTDAARYASCLTASETRDAIRADSVAAAALKVSGTPTMLVAELRVVGAPSPASLDSLIDRAKAGRSN